MKNLKWFSGFLILLICSCSNVSKSQDIALNKQYTVSSPANYALASPDADHKLLTDGIYTNGYFWTTKTTVGWQYQKRVNIEIDLNQPSPIDDITFNTVRGGAGVEFPSNIFVFTSTDKKTYTYAGDAAVDPGNVHGTYEIKKFALSGINRTARYVQLVIIPNGAFVFCDEIEVIAGHNRQKNNLSSLANITNVNNAVDSLMKHKSNVKKMAYQMARYKGATNSSDTHDDPEMLVRTTSDADITKALNNAKAKRLVQLKNTYKNDIIIDQVNPWEGLSAPYQPRGTNNNTYNIITTIHGVQFGAFVITNLSNTEQLFNCTWSGTPDLTLNELFTVPFVTSGKDYIDVADPLVPSNRVKLESGESGVFLFKITGKKAGQAASKINIQSGSFASQLLININVLSQGSPNGYYAINADAWAYLTYPLINDRQDVAINDLLAHHINTMAVPPNIVPIVGSTDFSAFARYIPKLKSFYNIFIFMNFDGQAYKNSFKQNAFMSDAWKAKFISWYNTLVQNAQSAGIPPSKIFLYPYDEVQGADIGPFSDFLKWLKSDHPNIHTFATLANKPAIDALTPLLTISQVANIKDVLQEAQSKSVDKWLYDTQSNAELLSPYSYYRLMAWKAFYNNYTGIGFWNYADYENGSTNKIDLDNFDGVNATNYSVIYDGPGKSLISSRRWEAFSLGIEDYELLKIYALKNGRPKAKALAATVINNPDDASKADLIRNQILLSLSN